MSRTNKRIGTAAGIRPAAGPFSGFSLIEVLISLVILSVGLLAVAQMQVAAIRSIAFSRHMTSATYLARQQLEYLRSLPYDDSTPAAAPIGNGGNQIKSKSNVSVFLDTHNSATCGDNVWGSTLEHAQNPLNEEGLPAQVGAGTSFYVAWRVMRGLNHLCTACASNPDCASAIGPNQMAIEMQVIWWEERDNRPANPDIDGSTWGALAATGAHRVVLTALRQQNL